MSTRACVTALEQYIRLEAVGRWREGSEDVWREVLVSFGNASLVLSDFEEHPLTHWSLAAVERTDGGGPVARYAPDAESGEVLEVRDVPMIEAIAATAEMARIHGTVRKRRPWGLLGFCALVLAGVAMLGVWGPGLLRERALGLVSPEHAALISQDVEQALGVEACGTPAGLAALASLEARLNARVSVMPWERPRMAVLPAGAIVLSQKVVEEAGSAEEIAGWIALGQARGEATSPLAAWVETRDLWEVIWFLGTGEISGKDVGWMAGRLRSGRLVVDLETVEATAARLEAADVNAAPFRMAVAPLVPAHERGAVTAEAARDAPSLMNSDRDWVALQNICSG
ncbi:MAG: hypothetical protein AAF813_12915 [Pseudomonadota bacterium]